MELKLLCGINHVEKKSRVPYDELVCSFLDDFSDALRKDKQARQYPDVMSFAFWARRGNIWKKKREYEKIHEGNTRMGKGVVFHVAPSNVPINSMFSFAFGLLSGNANIVRLPSKGFVQVDCMCRVLNDMLENEKYEEIKNTTAIVSYPREEKKWTDYYSSLCNMRVIWGGDKTIQSIRKSELPPRSTEITFADRYSFGVISVQEILLAGEDEMRRLAEGFYNDTYLFDQNACSAPHLICWYRKGCSDSDCIKAQEKFWKCVSRVAEKYDFVDIKVSEKIGLLYQRIMENENIHSVRKLDNLVVVCGVKEINNAVEDLRGQFGLFYEYEFDNFEQLLSLSSEKVQTCAFFGIEPNELLELIKSGGMSGIDRIVPFGKTLDIDTHWDGYDLVDCMSREVCIQR